MSRFSSWSHGLILAGITLLAAVLRLWHVNESLWVDELHTSWCVQAGFWQVYQRAVEGNQSPLYFYLVWGVTRLLGESEFTLRLLSLLAGLALPGMVWLLVWQVWRTGNSDAAEPGNVRDDSAREWSALLAAFLVAVDHASIFYSTEARPYACLELLAVVVLFAAFTDQFRPSQASPPYLILASAALFYFHYTSALYLAGIFSLLLVWAIFWPSKSYDARSWLLDLGGIAAICAPALMQVVGIASRRENWGTFIEQADLADLLATFPWAIAPAGLLLLGLWRTTYPSPRGLPLLCCAALLPILLAWAVTWLDVARLFHPRYLVASLPALWAAVAIASQVPPTRMLRCTATFAIAVLAVLYSGIGENFLSSGRVLIDRRENWPAAVSAVKREHQQHPRWKILVHSGLIETDALRQPHDVMLREYGLLPVKALYRLDVEDDALIPLSMHEPGKLPAEVRDEVLRAGGAVIILRLSAVNAVAVEDSLAESFADMGADVTVLDRHSFGDVQVLTVRVEAH